MLINSYGLVLLSIKYGELVLRFHDFCGILVCTGLLDGMCLIITCFIRLIMIIIDVTGQH